ncbi:hypothetical protein ACFWD7_41235 [Streptomyces mirabilis]|uniref:hypothetical protein n=1 Tax=Streptomyces mirabilis TaxID=68239 RepID=UPI0036AD48CD
MTFREQSNKPGWSDWQLASEACGVRRRTCFTDDPQTELDQRMRDTFTADEARQADAYLATGTPDIARLAEIEARLDDASDDTKWLAEQLGKSWSQIDRLRDRIDDAGSLMDRDYVARAIGYVPWSREPTGG